MAFFMNTFKYTVFLANLIFFGLGCYLLYNLFHQMGSDFYNLTYENFKSPIYVSFIISAIIVIISFLGCCAACYETRCMIKTYAGLILLGLILQIAVVIMLYNVDPEEVKRQIKDKVIVNFENATAWQRSIQIIQQENKCCGIDNYLDYHTSDNKLPDSCCGKFDEKLSPSNATGICNKDNVFDGCKNVLTDILKENAKPLFIVIGLIFGLQLLVVILSCALSKNIREQYKVV